MPRPLFEYHPVVGYRFIPGIKARIPHEAGGYLVRSNTAGFRSDREFDREKKPGVRRVLLFGNSYTAGDGVSNGERYSDLLEQMLPDLEIFNFGLPGTGTDQQYLAYREFAKTIDHDLLIIAVLVENIRRVTARFRLYQDEEGKPVSYAKPYYEFLENRLVLKNVPPERRALPLSELGKDQWKHVERGGRFPQLRGWITRLGLKEWTQKVTRYQPFPEYNRDDSPAWRLLKAILKQWIGEHTKPVLLVPIPFYSHIEGTSSAANIQKRFGEIAQETSCSFFDPLEDLKRYPKKERRCFRFSRDIHPSPLGHRALATALAPVIQKLLPQEPVRRLSACRVPARLLCGGAGPVGGRGN